MNIAIFCSDAADTYQLAVVSALSREAASQGHRSALVVTDHGQDVFLEGFFPHGTVFGKLVEPPRILVVPHQGVSPEGHAVLLGKRQQDVDGGKVKVGGRKPDHLPFQVVLGGHDVEVRREEPRVVGVVEVVRSDGGSQRDAVAIGQSPQRGFGVAPGPERADEDGGGDQDGNDQGDDEGARHEFLLTHHCNDATAPAHRWITRGRVMIGEP
jgi:hypothetical protein